MRSKKYIADQVLYRLKGEYPETASNIDPRDLFAATENLINTNIKAQHFTGTMAAGETIPDGLILATYEDIPIVPYGSKRAKASLPVMPVSLPRNMGIAEVSTDADFICLLIPLQPGQNHLLQTQGSLSNLMNQVAYEPYGTDLILTKDVTAENRTKLYVRLVVSDVSRMSEYEPLPLPADMVSIIIEQLIKQFAPTPIETKAADIYTK
jgi:hypothetical protein